MLQTGIKARKTFALLTILSFLFSALGLVLLPTTVDAADVTAYIDLTAQPATAPSTISTAPELATSTADEFYISYIASASEFASSDVITISVDSNFTGVNTCASSTTDADGDTTADGSVGVSTNTVTYTFSADTTTATTTGVEICFAATTPASVGNYSIGVSDNNDSDISAALIYVGDDNEVNVTAEVVPVISLSIREPSTTSETNSCDLGNLNVASTNTCQYRVAAGTGQASGIDIYIWADDQLNLDGTPTTDIDDIADDTLDAGTEEHGIIVAVGSAFSIPGGSDFHATNYENVPVSAASREHVLEVNSAVDDSNTANWATITHGAAINSSTAAGSYTQEVHYWVFAGT